MAGPRNQSSGGTPLPAATPAGCPADCRVVPAQFDPVELRIEAAYQLRILRAQIMRDQGAPTDSPDTPLCNQDESSYAENGAFIGMYSKGLVHQANGEVVPVAYCTLLDGLRLDSVAAFDALLRPQLGAQFGCPTTPAMAAATATPQFVQLSPAASAVNNQLRLVNPLAAQAFDLEGLDSHQLQLFDWEELDEDGRRVKIPFPPPPRFDSAEAVAEMAEVYWMALSRDVPFEAYATTDPLGVTQKALADLSKFPYFTDLYQKPALTAGDLFRGVLKGDAIGPYVSQFLVRPVPYAAFTIDPRIRTVLATRAGMPAATLGGRDFATKWSEWLDLENGCDPTVDPNRRDRFDPKRRLILTGRDLGQYVHVDSFYEQYVAACQLVQRPHDPKEPIPQGLTGPTDATGNLVGAGMFPRVNGRQFDPLQCGNPYRAPDPANCPNNPGSNVEQGFGTLGIPDVKVLIAEVAKRALKAAWYQKWSIHRRIRPEEFGGRIEAHLSGKATYPFHADFTKLGDKTHPGVLQEVNAYNKSVLGDDTYLLPLAFPEGCPLHPSYPQGHATVAGACTTMLKALFIDANLKQHGVTIVEPKDANILIEYTGADATDMTVHGELNKLASNIGLARDFAGVHYRSDYAEGLRLGEAVAIWLLCDIRNTYAEDFAFTFETFDGHPIVIDKTLSACFRAGQLDEALAR